MANTIKFKRGSGSDPGTSDLSVGEIAIRTDTAKLFTKNDAGSVVEVSGGVDDGDKGDITVSSSGSVFTIDNDAVTYAKIQNVSATNRILGRDSSGAGVIEEITPANLRTMLNVADGATNVTNNNQLTNGAGFITDVVNDTSPQLGGTLDTNDQLISFGDSTGSTVNRLNFGAGNDLNIYHDGSDSYLRDSGTGQLNIWSNTTNILNSAGNEYCARFKENAEVELYHNNVMKLETESAGISVVGEGKFAGIVYPSANNTYNLGTTTNKWANVYATTLHGDGSNLTGISAGATGGGSDEIFYENGQNVTSDYTITNGKNAMSAGPITIDSGVTVTVGAGETLTIV